MTPGSDAATPRDRISRRALVARGGVLAGAASAGALLQPREAEAAPSGLPGATWTVRAEATGYIAQHPQGTAFQHAEPGAALQRAINALTPTGGTILIAKGMYEWGSVPEISSSLDRRLRILGEGGTLVRLSPAAPSFVAFRWPTADHETYGKVEIGHITFDANDVGGNRHVVIGSVHSSGNLIRANYEDIHVHDIVARNLPTLQSPDGRNAILFQVFQPTSGEGTQNFARQMCFERIDVRGGISAVDVTGIGPNRPVNCRVDDIYISDCHHDTGITPTTGPWGSSFHVGGHGFGGSCRVLHCTSRGIGDTGVEVNGMTDVVIEGCHVAEARGYGFYITNWRAIDATQHVTIRDCGVVRMTGTQGWGYRCNFNSAPLGSVVLSNCRYIRKTPDPLANGEAVLFNTAMESAVVDGFTIELEGAQVTGTPIQPPLIASWHQGNPNKLTVRDVVANVRATRTVPTSGFSIVGVNGTGRFLVDNVSVTGDVTGAGDPVVAVDIGRKGPSDLDGAVSNVRGEVGAIALRKVGVAGVGTLKIPGRLLVSNIDAISTSSECIKVDDATNRAKVFLENIGWRTAPSTSAITPTTSPYVYRNLTGSPRAIVIAGPDITKIEMSHNSSSYRTTGLTQGTVPIPNNGSVRVSWTGTVVPTMMAITL